MFLNSWGASSLTAMTWVNSVAVAQGKKLAQFFCMAVTQRLKTQREDYFQRIQSGLQGFHFPWGIHIFLLSLTSVQTDF